MIMAHCNGLGNSKLEHSGYRLASKVLLCELVTVIFSQPNIPLYITSYIQQLSGSISLWSLNNTQSPVSLMLPRLHSFDILHLITNTTRGPIEMEEEGCLPGLAFLEIATVEYIIFPPKSSKLKMFQADVMIALVIRIWIKDTQKVIISYEKTEVQRGYLTLKNQPVSERAKPDARSAAQAKEYPRKKPIDRGTILALPPAWHGGSLDSESLTESKTRADKENESGGQSVQPECKPDSDS
ncbi:hypothetical protein MG293_003933 [Ovis ammon polii]|uniref:Uncharacterized protein n=1 Tax=Ovis ammon polii TaxID=230172 RepID=A0AAD4YGU0_OVIAM|nr:hypothetical protein MG293_003933 [Ovis ammon polii]